MSSLLGGLGAVSGSSLLELLLLLESGSAGFGGGVLGNGCCVAALDGVGEGAGVSGGAAGFSVAREWMVFGGGFCGHWGLRGAGFSGLILLLAGCWVRGRTRCGRRVLRRGGLGEACGGEEESAQDCSCCGVDWHRWLDVFLRRFVIVCRLGRFPCGVWLGIPCTYFIGWKFFDYG